MLEKEGTGGLGWVAPGGAVFSLLVALEVCDEGSMSVSSVCDCVGGSGDCWGAGEAAMTSGSMEEGRMGVAGIEGLGKSLCTICVSVSVLTCGRRT